MESYKLMSVFFKKLKGLHDVKFVFEKPLTAIMGVNGAGKTTVIHALACVYRPPEGGHGEDHRFPEFFVPNTDALWQGSEFHVVNEKNEDGRKAVQSSRKFSKPEDRWNPHYAERLPRNVYYIGINTCLPEIEKEKKHSLIEYTSEVKNDRISRKITEEAAYILNKSYTTLLENTYNTKHFTGVSLQTGLRYSSLSMGTGEQRTIKILEKVLNAEPYSLILIDEIDLLLHVSSLKRLIQRLDGIARGKHLQIIFTTHALEMMELTQYVGIQYIDEVKLPDSSENAMVYSSINSELVYNLTGTAERPLKIYVEDELAKTVVKRALRTLNMSGKADVIKYGAIENAFTIAAAKTLAGVEIPNTLILLDGDKYCEKNEKIKQIRSKLSGTEGDIEEKWNQAVSLISEFNLPDGIPPEQFFHQLVLENGEPDDELVIAAAEIQSVHDTHEWLYRIQVKLNETESNIVRDIIGLSSNSPAWNDYIQPVMDWLIERREV